MADQQWPSEDEDFDSTSDSDNNTATATEPESRSVVVNDESEQEQVPESQEEPAQEQEFAPEEAAPAEASAAPEEVAPVAAEPPKASKVKRPKVPGHGVSRHTVLELVLAAVIIGLGLWTWSLKTDNTNLKNQVTHLNDNPQVAVQKQTEDLISKVGQLLQLPSGETPTIASVTDASQAKQQSAFFANAQNGDKVLMYVKAGEAILYRPSTNKIILVAPLTFSNSASSTPSTTKK